MEGQQYWLILPLAKTEVYCSDQREPEQTARIGAPARKNKVTAPKKVRNVAPNYPEAAQTNRIQGVVVIESTISSEGCVRDARVIRSVVTALDLEALRAVSLWRFTPTLLEGRPVPVIMTVTVNFTLQ
jgi:protein TonB